VCENDVIIRLITYTPRDGRQQRIARSDHLDIWVVATSFEKVFPYLGIEGIVVMVWLFELVHDDDGGCVCVCVVVLMKRRCVIGWTEFGVPSVGTSFGPWRP